MTAPKKQHEKNLRAKGKDNKLEPPSKDTYDVETGMYTLDNTRHVGGWFDSVKYLQQQIGFTLKESADYLLVVRYGTGITCWLDSVYDLSNIQPDDLEAARRLLDARDERMGISWK